MSIVLIRTFILYFIVLFAIRIMGKSELSKMSPFQMVVIFMIAELAAIPIESPTVSFISGVIAIFTLLFLQVLISYISIKSEKFKNFINGRPSVIIENGQINQEEMRRLRTTLWSSSVWGTLRMLQMLIMPCLSQTEVFPLFQNRIKKT